MANNAQKQISTHKKDVCRKANVLFFCKVVEIVESNRFYIGIFMRINRLRN